MKNTEKKNGKAQSGTPDEVRALLTAIRSADTNEESGFDALVERYLPLIEKTVEHFSDVLVSDTDRDDLRQEALMSLYRAAISFDLSQSKVSFGLYAQICMTNRMISFVRSYQKRREEQILPIDERICSDETPLAAIEEEERVRRTYEVIRRVLSPFEYTVWCHYVGGSAIAEIAISVGKDEKSISNAISRIRRKLREARTEFDF